MGEGSEYYQYYDIKNDTSHNYGRHAYVGQSHAFKVVEPCLYPDDSAYQRSDQVDDYRPANRSLLAYTTNGRSWSGQYADECLQNTFFHVLLLI